MNRSSVPFRPAPRLLFGSLLLAAWACAVPGVADTAVIRGDRVNIRSQPSLEGEVLAWMKRGETVETQGGAKDGFIRIALPSKVAVWVHAPLVDRASRQVKAAEAKLRVGPGRNYGELGVLKKGATLMEIRESDGWLQVEPPAGFSAYVGARFVEASGAAPARVTAAKTGGILPADGDPVPSAPPVAAPARPAAVRVPVPPTPVKESVPPPVSAPIASQAPGPSAGSEGLAQSTIEYSEKVRVVNRVGKVVRSLEPQSPSHYQLRSPQRGEGMLGFLVGQDPQTPIASFRGKQVRVVAEEYVDPRSRTQVILKVQSIEEFPAR